MAIQKYEDFFLKFYESKHEFEAKRARLFPAVEKLKVIDEDVTSNIFMASLVGIKEYCEAFFQEIGIKLKSNSKVHAYSQIDFKNGSPDGKNDIPDGMLVITEGKTNPIITWTALLEFKTKGDLQKDQILRYSKIAKDNKLNIDAIITISNDFVSCPEQNPLGLTNTKALKYYHFSWIRLQSILQNTIQQGISDDDQDYIAKQLLLYMKEHKFILNFDLMNADWPDQSKKIISSKKLSDIKDKKLFDCISLDWLQEEQDLCLKLKAKYYKDISVKMTPSEAKKIEERLSAIKKRITDKSDFYTIYRVIPDKSKNMPYCITSKSFFEISNQILLTRKLQIITTEIVSDNWSRKTLRSKIEFFINSILKSDPAMMKELKILVYKKDKKTPISEKSLEQYRSEIHNDILAGFEDSNSQIEIRKIELKCSFDLGSYFISRNKFIWVIERNYTNYYSQFIEPFTL